MVNFVCDNGVRDRIAVIRSTSDHVRHLADVQTKPKPARDSATDTRILAQVEKWMAMIREIKQRAG